MIDRLTNRHLGDTEHIPFLEITALRLIVQEKNANGTEIMWNYTCPACSLWGHRQWRMRKYCPAPKIRQKLQCCNLSMSCRFSSSLASINRAQRTITIMVRNLLMGLNHLWKYSMAKAKIVQDFAFPGHFASWEDPSDIFTCYIRLGHLRLAIFMFSDNFRLIM